MLDDGRIVLEYPDLQIVLPRVAWVTAGLSAPGVQRPSGREYTVALLSLQEPAAGCGWMLVADASDTASDPGPTEGSDALPDPAVTGTVVASPGDDGDAPH